VLDTRSAGEFGAGHVPGALHIGLSGQFASWAGTLIGLDTPLVLVAAGPEQLKESQIRLARVGIENIAGFLSANAGKGAEEQASGQAIVAWERAGLPLNRVPQMAAIDLQQELSDQVNAVQVVDVRRPTEWEAGHIQQARLKPLHKLRTMLSDLDTQRPIVVHCKSGYRSSIATSLLLRAGFKNVMNVVGGFDAWQAQRLPVVVEVPSAQAARQ
jgi:rhodanese-related sulfurtransferase